MAMDPNENTLVMWQRSHRRIQGRVVLADGTLGPTLAISALGANVHGPQVSENSAGDVVIVWEDAGQIQLREWTSDGSLTPIESITPTGGNAFSPQVGVDAAGRARIAWVHSGGGNYRIQNLVRAADGSTGPIRPLSPSMPTYMDYPDMAVNASGHASVVWMVFSTPHAIQSGYAPSC
jgi:hypothetical protein